MEAEVARSMIFLNPKEKKTSKKEPALKRRRRLRAGKGGAVGPPL
jgi:hypothetical protein